MYALTVRHNEVIALLSEGLTNRGIARRLHIAPNTVRNHIYDIYGRLEIYSRAQAAVAYMREDALVGARGNGG